jgi:hypothetical protein
MRAVAVAYEPTRFSRKDECKEFGIVVFTMPMETGEAKIQKTRVFRLDL